MQNKIISPSETATRLSKAGCPTSESSVRRWCSEGFGIRLMGRWRIPETRVAELERKLSAAGNCHEVSTCRICGRFLGWRDVFGPNISSFRSAAIGS